MHWRVNKYSNNCLENTITSIILKNKPTLIYQPQYHVAENNNDNKLNSDDNHAGRYWISTLVSLQNLDLLLANPMLNLFLTCVIFHVCTKCHAGFIFGLIFVIAIVMKSWDLFLAVSPLMLNTGLITMKNNILRLGHPTRTSISNNHDEKLATAKLNERQRWLATRTWGTHMGNRPLGGMPVGTPRDTHVGHRI